MIWLSWFRVALTVFFIAAAILTVSLKAKSGAWLGFQQAIVSHSSAQSVAEYSAYHAGELIGLFSIGLILIGITLAAIAHNRRKLAEVCLLIETIISARSGGAPLLQPICMSLLCLPSVGRYFESRRSERINQTAANPPPPLQGAPPRPPVPAQSVSQVRPWVRY